MGQASDEPSFLERALDDQQAGRRNAPQEYREAPADVAAREAAEQEAAEATRRAAETARLAAEAERRAAEAARLADERAARDAAERAARAAALRAAALREAAEQEAAVRDGALLDEAMRKSALVWVRTPTSPAGRAVWYAWLEGRAYLVTGAEEQPDPGLPGGGAVGVVVRSKDDWSRLLSFEADVTRLLPGDPDWEAAVAELAKSRLNLRQTEAAPRRWADDAAYALYRLTPAHPLTERPGGYDEAGAGRAAPVPTSATTATAKPWVLHERGGSGTRLS